MFAPRGPLQGTRQKASFPRDRHVGLGREFGCGAAIGGRIDEDRIVRVVFTDFDGVLHPASAAIDLKRSTVQGASPAELRAAGLFVHTHVLASALRGAWDTEEIRVVVHSSWRSHFRDDEIRNFIPDLATWYRGTVGFTTLSRDAAIQKWLEMSEPRVTDYLVLDDAPGLFAGGTAKWPNLVLCDAERGLDDPAAREELGKFIVGKRNKDDDLGAIEFEPVNMADLIAQMKQR